MGLIFLGISVGIIMYMSFNILMLNKRNKKNRRLIALFDAIDTESVFFKMCDEFIEGIHDEEFETKGKIFKLWGLAKYKRYDEFKKVLETLDLNPLIYKKYKFDGAELNEDSFYYICIGVPHLLYVHKQFELLKLVEGKIAEVEDKISNRLIKVIGDNNCKYYYKEDDLGQGFYEAVLEGNYGQYKYSRQLIGLFKNIVSCMLGRIYMDKGDTEKYETIKADIVNFNKSKLGKSFVQELRLDVRVEEKKENE